MPLPIISNCYRAAIHWTQQGVGFPTETLNVLHVTTTTQDEADIAVILQTQIGTYGADALFNLSSDYKMTLVQVTKLDGSSATQDIPVDGPYGEADGDYIPQGAQVISLKTAHRGPSGRGRIYLGPCGEQNQVDGALGGTDSVNTGWANVLAGINGADLTLVVASYVHAVARPVTSISSKGFLRTQRRRARR